MTNSLDDVISGALRVLDSFGLEFCSMRRVAAELDVQPSALYHHVENKQTLLAHMADRIIADVLIDDDIAASCRRLRAAMLSVRDGAEVVATASAFGLGATSLLGQFGDRLGSRDAARTLVLYVFGHTQATQMHDQAVAVGIVEADPELESSFEPGLALILSGVSALT